MSIQHRSFPDFRGAEPLSPPADFSSSLVDIGVSLDSARVGQLARYFAALLSMNEEMNLTAIKEPAQVWEKHGLDALSLVPQLPATARSLLDVGSGGGVPGVVLAIARPDLQVTLLEATQKKAAFLTALAVELCLDNVRVVAERAETAVRTRTQSFDVVTARAVARLEKLLPLTAPFAKLGGLLLLVKGARADEELEEAKHNLKRLDLRHERTVLTPTGRIVVLQKSK
jgi:16S rRNA (guanine527-N7)-methyltransferase